MASLEIAVRGSAHGRCAPERATVSITIAVEGGRRETVFRDAVAVHQPLVDDLAALSEAGAVSNWHSGAVRVYSHRPFDGERQLDRVFTTRIEVSATFVDFESLSDHLDRWAVGDGVEIGGVTWGIAEETHAARMVELRREAIADAVAKATAYAEALGHTEVTAVSVTEPTAEPDSFRPARFSKRAMVASAPEPTLELTPEDVALEVAIDVGFTAGS
ncbi:SIMPL domain-containing protein [Gordonia soli]|nr:SIMPL domain-containing protein [Gordonia soli]